MVPRSRLKSRTMKIHLSPRVVLAVLFLCLALGSSVFVQTQSATPSQKEAIMPNHATGPFDVKVTPQDDKSEDATLGRMTLDKQYHGDLEAARARCSLPAQPTKDQAGTSPSKRSQELFMAAPAVSCCNTAVP
ncbi:MAG: DUF3224 domain-containing protein [Candidatus Sulfotelmatobacter sp.]